MNATVRRVESARDRAELSALLAEYERGLPPDLRHGELPSAAALVDLTKPPSAALIAVHEGCAVGSVLLRDLDRTSAVVQRLYVRHLRRGAGIGRALVTAAIDHARTHEYRRLVLDTDPVRLAPAYRLYRSLGFRPCEPYAPVSYANPAFLELIL